jgi:flagellar assembly factor FliW
MNQGKPLKIESPRFGTLEVDPSRIIEFPKGLVGLEGCRRFSLFHAEGGEPTYFILQSLDDPAIAFHIADPAKFGFGYEIVLSDEEAADLDLAEGERSVSESTAQIAVVVILSKESAGQPVSANLNGPLIINLDKRLGLQHVFVRLDYNLKTA